MWRKFDDRSYIMHLSLLLLNLTQASAVVMKLSAVDRKICPATKPLKNPATNSLAVFCFFFNQKYRTLQYTENEHGQMSSE